MYGRRRKISPEETAANAARKADRLAAAMTCQCCARKYLANTGTIAHHGYKRPGYGWQTASCMGAKYMPFEVGRTRLADLLVTLRQWEDRKVNEIEETKNEVRPIFCSYQTRGTRAKNWTDKETIKFEVTAANIAEMRLKHGTHTYVGYSWETMKEKTIEGMQSRLDALRKDIKDQQARYDGWKQTHVWDKTEWKWKQK